MRVVVSYERGSPVLEQDWTLCIILAFADGRDLSDLTQCIN